MTALAMVLRKKLEERNEDILLNFLTLKGKKKLQPALNKFLKYITKLNTPIMQTPWTIGR
jgi:hypothetical protein